MNQEYALGLLALTSLILTLPAHAQQPIDRPLDYDYIFANLAISELDTGGLEVGASYSLLPNLHLFGGYQDWELNENVDRSILQVGGRYHWDIAPNLDLSTALALADSEFDTPGPGDVEDEGFILSAALRSWITAEVELSGELLVDDSLGSDTDTVIEVGGQYHLSNQLSLGGRVRIDEDDTTLFIGGRFHFLGTGAGQPQQP